jgi:hypothetical protein
MQVDKISEGARLALQMMGLVYLDDSRQLRQSDGSIVGTLSGVAVNVRGESTEYSFKMKGAKPMKFIPVTINLMVDTDGNDQD